MFLRLFVYTLAVALALPVNLYAQSYGLRFVGHEDIQDSRTSLDLSPKEPFCFKGTVELSFDLSLVPSYKTYFGYIFRIIQQDNQNLDLIYDQDAKRFKLIAGERYCPSTIQLDSTRLFSQWNRFRFRLDLKNKALSAYVNDQLVIQDKISFQEEGCFRIFFGGNDFREFKSKDLPPMNIKDIALSENGRQCYHWPLKEGSAITTEDALTGEVASVKNPVWIQSLHNEWQLTKQLVVKGNASVAFDLASETVYVVGTDQLYSYSLRNRQEEQRINQVAPPSFLPGNQAFFNPLTRNLYSLYIDQKALSAYHPASQSWTSEAITPKFTLETEYWHANKFVSALDSCLYILGGYGQLRYKNSVQRYRFATRQWEILPTQGSVFSPRYLAALGTNPAGDTAYVVGGYGSLTGEQMLNPKSSYDFLQYVVKENTFQKLFEWKVPETDFAFANSLIIDSKNRQFYGLIFPNQQFKSHLQLIRGSLSEPTYEPVGNTIPYPFHDIRSFADLYFCPISQKLAVVTLYKNENNLTEVKLYTISFPPNQLVAKPVENRLSAGVYRLLIIVGLVSISIAFVYYRKRNPHTMPPPTSLPLAEKTPERQVPTQEESALFQPAWDTEPAQPSTFFFFGNFQVFGSDGHDLTKSFTPLLKELFLLLALNSIGKHRGVASEKLNELLWPDKSGRDVSNNRSVNIAKLRAILDKVGHCSLSKQSGYWKVDFNFSHVHFDYDRYLTIIRDKAVLTKQAIIELGNITERGSFLLNTEYTWLDDFKADVSNQIINTFLHYAENMDISNDPEFLIQITNYIFDYDSVNEEAIILKCKALALMGKHTLAKNTFEKFARDYKAIYGEEYEQTFPAIMD